MTPTNQLRWVKREVYDETTDFYGHTIQVLQQKWENENAPIGFKEEWRDVPVEEEKSNETN